MQPTAAPDALASADSSRRRPCCKRRPTAVPRSSCRDLERDHLPSSSSSVRAKSNQPTPPSFFFVFLSLSRISGRSEEATEEEC
ncbi:hypothetical protein LINPERPRIM_LOCUS38956 [Linum perenne]